MLPRHGTITAPRALYLHQIQPSNSIQFVHDIHFANHDSVWLAPTTNTPQRELTIEGSSWLISMQDISLAPMLAQEAGFRSDIFEDILMKADGVIFLYDITDESSFDLITEYGYELVHDCRREKTDTGKPYLTGRQRFGCVLVGNKLDIVEKDPEKRQVGKERAADWADMHRQKHYEVNAFRRDELEEVARGLVRSIEKAERRDKEDMERTLEERWKENQFDMWGQNVEPWGEFKTLSLSADQGGEGEKREGEKEEQEACKRQKEKEGEKKGLSRSFSQLREALPRFRSKAKALAQ
jgi:GTPase SAR1 family protein